MQSSSNKYGKLHVVTNGVNESVDNSLAPKEWTSYNFNFHNN